MEYRPYIASFFKTLAALVAFGLIVLAPYGWWFIAKSGDVDLQGVVRDQAAGRFVVFGSGVSQDFVDYKLALYSAVKPDIIVLGSSRVMQFRSKYFTKKFLNIGGTAGNIAVLRSTIEAMLKTHTPEAVILGLDFWWFTQKWEADPYKEVPPTSGTYAYSFDVLKTPYEWLLDGKLTAGQFFAPLTGGFETHLYGVMAQKTGDGFATDGSWYYTADVTGQQHPFDHQFQDTLKQVRYGIKAFAAAPAISAAHLDALGEVLCKLQSRGIRVYLFISPLSQLVYDAMYEREKDYPQAFQLAEALRARGVEVQDYANPRILKSSDCEFVDGFHGGDVTYARILRALADKYPSLLRHVDILKLDEDIHSYEGFAMVPDERVTRLPEVDFMHFRCRKQRVAAPDYTRPTSPAAPRTPGGKAPERRR
ncbi:MAG: hypothetical protein LBH94_03325 [Deltaproteobacteria bacterium]|jgi:hypothetical protein|nr:hypothetical protein [Deltaproteobacteria bacterium]